jgi:hypothetical protein
MTRHESYAGKILPIDLMSFMSVQKMQKACTATYHYQVDQTGGIKYEIQKGIGQNIFGYNRCNLKNHFETKPAEPLDPSPF